MPPPPPPQPVHLVCMHCLTPPLHAQLLNTMLLVQERTLAGVVLLGVHLATFMQADDVILREIPSSHPYLTGLGILGGINVYANPLQGRYHFVSP